MLNSLLDDKPTAVSQEAIIRRICSDIRSGRLRPGEQLRLREDLIGDFNTTSTTIQRAFTRLLNDGFVVSRRRVGTFVAERPPNLCRIGLAFLDTKAASFQEKHLLALVTAAAAAYGENAERTLVPYYGVLLPGNDGDRQRLIADAKADRLSGIIWTYGQHILTFPDDLVERCGLPSVFFSSQAPGITSLGGLDFPKRALDEVARMGGRKVGVLLHTGNYSVSREYLEAAATLGLEIRSPWFFGIDLRRVEWALPILEGMMLWPEADRPDSLIVSNDHFVESVLSALVRLGVKDRLKVVFHANFPVTTPPIPGMPRVGYDSRESLGVAIALIDRINGRARLGLPPESMHVRIPSRAEHEVPAEWPPIAKLTEQYMDIHEFHE